MKTFVYVCAVVFGIAALGMTGTVNTGRNTVIVPNVEDVTVQVASEILHNAGLYPDIPAAADLSSLVTRQHPRPGEMLAPGGKVVLFTKEASSTITTTVPGVPAVPTPAPGSYGISPGESGISAYGPGTVTPTQPTTQSNQPVVTGGQSTILYQPPQPRVSPYFVQDTVPRFYPSWYPRAFLVPATPQASSQALSSQTLSQPVVSDGYAQPMYYITADEAASYIGQPSSSTTETSRITAIPVISVDPDLRYPKVGPEPEGWMGIQGITPQQAGVYETSAFPALSVPYILRLRQEDAVAALTKAGLAVEVFQVDDAQVRPGLVVNQSPAARSLVPAGTKVQLWIAR